MTLKPYPYANYSRDVTWAEDSETSNAVNIRNAAPRGMALECADTTGWTAADVAFQVSADGETWLDVLDSDGARVVVALAAGVVVAPAELWLAGGYSYLRLVSVDGSDSTTEVEQAAAPAMRLVFAS